MYDRKFEYEVIDINKEIMDRIVNRMKEGEKFIQELQENKFSPDCISWILSFSSFIYELDPYGEHFSNSLASEWSQAGGYGNVCPKTKEEYNITLSQYLGVAKSLLNGKVKIVKKKIEYNRSNFFHKRNLPIQNNFVFVLMPFTEAWSDYIWKEEIKPIVQGIEEYHLICKRADDLYGHDVMQDIYESILTASIVIADITNRNANVFYELGIAHSLGKEVILLAQGVEYIPFDLNRFRHCIYSNDGMGYKKLRQYLPEAIKDILQKTQNEI